jgi:hypothetical protein
VEFERSKSPDSGTIVLPKCQVARGKCDRVLVLQRPFHLPRISSTRPNSSKMVSPQMYVYNLTKCTDSSNTVCSTNLAIILVMMQLAKKVPFDNPDVLMGVRALYIVSNVLIVGIYLWTQAKINSKKGMYPVTTVHSWEAHATIY